MSILDVKTKVIVTTEYNYFVDESAELLDITSNICNKSAAALLKESVCDYECEHISLLDCLDYLDKSQVYDILYIASKKLVRGGILQLDVRDIINISKAIGSYSLESNDHLNNFLHGPRQYNWDYYRSAVLPLHLENWLNSFGLKMTAIKKENYRVYLTFERE